LLSDVAYAFRRLARAPGYAAISVVTLALGIGANTAVFSLVKTVVIAPLPYGDPDRLTMLWGTIEKGATTYLSGPELRDYAAETRTFANVAAYTGAAANLTGGQEPERVVAAAVSPNIFATLGVPALVGHAFTPSGDPQEMADEVVLSYSLWQRRFGESRDIVGQRILVDGAQTTVIGVMPAEFRLPLDFGDDRPSELWRPLDLRTPEWAAWGNHSLIGVARLRGAVSLELATATMHQLEDRWIRDQVGGGWNDRDIVRRAAVPIKDLVLGDVRPALWVLLGAVGVILVIACANVANLMLAKSDQRYREIAVRTAMGASRGRIVQQLLSESLLLSALGGAAGLGIAALGMRALLILHPPGIPRIEQAGLDFSVLAFTLGLALATGVVFGMAPALELSRADLNTPLRESGWTGTTGRASQRFRDSLAVAQMAFSVVLLIGALLLVRSFIELRRIDLGFNPRNVLTFRVVLPVASYAQDADAIRVVQTLRQRFAELPGVRAVGATRLLPLTGTIGDWSITLEGREKAPGENPNGDWQVVTPGYFESMGMKLARGRSFAETDNEKAPIVAVINDTMAARYWPGEDPIGKRFRVSREPFPWITIVGIVAQIRHNAVTEKARAEMYVPHGQWGAAGGSTRRAMTFVIRTSADPLGVFPHVRETVRSLDSNLPLAEVRTLEQVSADALSQARFTTLLLCLFAGLALALATIGIYGVISLLVARRRREIGIRMALGAYSTTIVGMVVGRGMTLAAVGVGLGLVAAAGLTRVVASLLYAVTPFDPVTFTAVPVLLASVALMACVIPAGRAARLNPVVALREE
jgi:putative ABC transport system permease protein